MPRSAPTCASTDFNFEAPGPNSIFADGKETFSFPSPKVFPPILEGVCRSNVNDNLSVWNTLGFSPGTLVARRPPPSLSMRWRVFLAISLFCKEKNCASYLSVEDCLFGGGIATLQENWQEWNYFLFWASISAFKINIEVNAMFGAIIYLDGNHQSLQYYVDGPYITLVSILVLGMFYVTCLLSVSTSSSSSLVTCPTFGSSYTTAFIADVLRELDIPCKRLPPMFWTRSASWPSALAWDVMKSVMFSNKPTAFSFGK